jgi:hypothetical protein
MRKLETLYRNRVVFAGLLLYVTSRGVLAQSRNFEFSGVLCVRHLQAHLSSARVARRHPCHSIACRAGLVRQFLARDRGLDCFTVLSTVGENLAAKLRKPVERGANVESREYPASATMRNAAKNYATR